MTAPVAFQRKAWKKAYIGRGLSQRLLGFFGVPWPGD